MHHRHTYINSATASNPKFPMTSVVYGFRPESGWPGVLFQVFLQGPFISLWQKQKELEFWVAFGSNSTKAAFFELESEVVLPDIDNKRYVLQCVVPPEAYSHGDGFCSINLKVSGNGGKTIASDLFMGRFKYRQNGMLSGYVANVDGTLNTYNCRGNMVALLKWLEQYPPEDIHSVTAVNRQELRQPTSPETIEILPQYDAFAPSQFPQYQFSQGTSRQLFLTIESQIPQLHRDSQGQMWRILHNGEIVPVDESQPPQAYNQFQHYLTSQNQTQPSIAQGNPVSFESRSQMSPFQVKMDLPVPLSRPLTPSPPRLQMHPSPHHPHSPARRRGFGRITFHTKPDQMSLSDLWTPQERHDHRRIVQFHKISDGDHIQVDCHPVLATDYTDNMFTISCIYFRPNPPGEIQHKLAGKCVFTSVDVILLMERLTNHYFDVKEKNRIRRNLEGFRPETIKKEGTTYQFFHQVMAYTQPKARNIEKDIKVFLWSDIAKAMRKIMQKYHTDGSIQLGQPMVPVQNSGPSQNSSSESLPTQPSYMDYSQPSQIPTFLTPEFSSPPEFSPPSEFTYPLLVNPTTHLPPEEEDTSGFGSISPQSQTSQLVVPTAEYGRQTDEYAHQIHVGGDYVAQQELERYTQNMPGKSGL
jgi:hypothetical protein